VACCGGAAARDSFAIAAAVRSWPPPGHHGARRSPTPSTRLPERPHEDGFHDHRPNPSRPSCSWSRCFAALLSLAPAARAERQRTSRSRSRSRGRAPIAIYRPPTADTLRNNAPLHRGDAVHVDITKDEPGRAGRGSYCTRVTAASGLVHAGVDDGSVSFDFTVPSDLAARRAQRDVSPGVTVRCGTRSSRFVRRERREATTPAAASNSPPGKRSPGAAAPGRRAAATTLASTGVERPRPA